MNKEILNKYIELIDKGYCDDCNELNCLGNFPHKDIVKNIKAILEENQELKKQLENNAKINIADHKYASKCEDKVIVVENQQKEFIEWLEQNIENEKYCYLSADKNNQVRYDIFSEILSKYKEIIGSDNK